MNSALQALLLDILSDETPVPEETKEYVRILEKSARFFECTNAGLFLAENGCWRTLAWYPFAHSSQQGQAPENILRKLDPAVAGETVVSIAQDDGANLFFAWAAGGSSRLALGLFSDSGEIDLEKVSRVELERFAVSLGRFLVKRYTDFRIAGAKEHLQTLFDHFPVAVCVINENHEIERINLAFAELFSCSFWQAVGHKCYRIICKRSRPPGDCPLDKSQRCQQPIFHQLGRNPSHRVTVLPMSANDCSWKTLHLIYGDTEEQQIVQALWLTFFSDLYNRLSQPLTALALKAEMLATGAAEPGSRELASLQHEVREVIHILRQERTSLFQALKPERTPNGRSCGEPEKVLREEA